ncbi:MAG: hypothetical protein PHQ23_16400, partial [Candidatus Wallbacteria bacterium]|nr:hypothetical protein [Candidatus Wallbacteria bacterium]
RVSFLLWAMFPPLVCFLAKITLRGSGPLFKAFTNLQKGFYTTQGRFSSYPMDDSYLLKAARYIELNPVHAGLVKKPGAWKYSSAKAHLQGKNDLLVKTSPLLHLVDEWSNFLSMKIDDSTAGTLKRHESTGRPLGDEDFIAKISSVLGRDLKKKKPGPVKGWKK